MQGAEEGFQFRRASNEAKQRYAPSLIALNNYVATEHLTFEEKRRFKVYGNVVLRSFGYPPVLALDRHRRFTVRNVRRRVRQPQHQPLVVHAQAPPGPELPQQPHPPEMPQQPHAPEMQQPPPDLPQLEDGQGEAQPVQGEPQTSRQLRYNAYRARKEALFSPPAEDEDDPAPAEDEDEDEDDPAPAEDYDPPEDESDPAEDEFDGYSFELLTSPFPPVADSAPTTVVDAPSGSLTDSLPAVNCNTAPSVSLETSLVTSSMIPSLFSPNFTHGVSCALPFPMPTIAGPTSPVIDPTTSIGALATGGVGPSTVPGVGPPPVAAASTALSGPTTSVGPSTSHGVGPSTSHQAVPLTIHGVGPPSLAAASTASGSGGSRRAPTMTTPMGPSTSHGVGPSTSHQAVPLTIHGVGPPSLAAASTASGSGGSRRAPMMTTPLDECQVRQKLFIYPELIDVVKIAVGTMALLKAFPTGEKPMLRDEWKNLTDYYAKSLLAEPGMRSIRREKLKDIQFRVDDINEFLSSSAPNQITCVEQEDGYTIKAIARIWSTRIEELDKLRKQPGGSGTRRAAGGRQAAETGGGQPAETGGGQPAETADRNR